MQDSGGILPDYHLQNRQTTGSCSLGSHITWSQDPSDCQPLNKVIFATSFCFPSFHSTWGLHFSVIIHIHHTVINITGSFVFVEPFPSWLPPISQHMFLLRYFRYPISRHKRTSHWHYSTVGKEFGNKIPGIYAKSTCENSENTIRVRYGLTLINLVKKWTEIDIE